MTRRRGRKATPVEAALERARKHNIGYTVVGPDSWSVDSSTHEWRYQVTLVRDEWQCTCEARGYCMHIALIQFRTGAYVAELRKESLRMQEREEREWQEFLKQPLMGETV